MTERRSNFVRTVTLALSLVLVTSLSARNAALPEKLSDAEFWKLASDSSEPDAFFRITDNYTSNEREIGQVFAMLREAGVKGGVYLGVGPEQNLTYIAAIRPAMAFVIDIRRQAAMQHLMFKAIFEFAPDRAEFISLLFSKPRPEGLTASSDIQKIWEAYTSVATDQAMATKTWDRLLKHLTETHKFALNAEEIGKLQAVFGAFTAYGPAISTRGTGGAGVTFADLTGWAYDYNGKPQSFLSSDDNYRTVKTLHDKNLIVPVTGDFGGTKALRAVAAFLKKEGGAVSAFYVSNVEQYLFQDGKNAAFYDNVAAMPITDQSVFIRPYSLRRGGGTTQSLCSIAGFLGAVTAGRVYSNNDALACIKGLD
jgi:hypothetical protein